MLHRVQLLLPADGKLDFTEKHIIPHAPFVHKSYHDLTQIGTPQGRHRISIVTITSRVTPANVHAQIETNYFTKLRVDRLLSHLSTVGHFLPIRIVSSYDCERITEAIFARQVHTLGQLDGDARTSAGAATAGVENVPEWLLLLHVIAKVAAAAEDGFERPVATFGWKT